MEPIGRDKSEDEPAELVALLALWVEEFFFSHPLHTTCLHVSEHEGRKLISETDGCFSIFLSFPGAGNHTAVNLVFSQPLS